MVPLFEHQHSDRKGCSSGEEHLVCMQKPPFQTLACPGRAGKGYFLKAGQIIMRQLHQCSLQAGNDHPCPVFKALAKESNGPVDQNLILPSSKTGHSLGSCLGQHFVKDEMLAKAAGLLATCWLK